jgi:hypothetical protein
LSITQTVLVFVGIPALVVLVAYSAVYGTAARRVSKRYRPGRPFSFAPVWFLAGTDDTGSGRATALGAGERRAELPPGPLLAQATATDHGETGGASDRW